MKRLGAQTVTWVKKGDACRHRAEEAGVPGKRIEEDILTRDHRLGELRKSTRTVAQHQTSWQETLKAINTTLLNVRAGPVTCNHPQTHRTGSTVHLKIFPHASR